LHASRPSTASSSRTRSSSRAEKTAAAGGAAGALTDVGVDDRFMKDLGEKLEPGKAALIVLVHRSTPDKVLPEISQFQGEIIQSSLSDEAEAELRKAIESEQTAATA
jgi:uncharacterized membrane protein